jgi:subfamily B ATP-binding cassette protein MsbA
VSRFSELVDLLRAYRGNLAANVFFNILNAVFSLFTFLSVVPFLRILFAEGDPSPAAGRGEGLLADVNHFFDSFVAAQGKPAALLSLCLGIVGVALVKNLVGYLALFSLATIRTGISRDLRRRLYDKVLSLPVGWFTEARKGDVISRMTNDLMEVEFSIIGTIEILFKSPVMILVSLTTLFVLSWELTLFALIFLPLSGYLISRIAKSLKHAAKHGKEQLGTLISVIEETLGGMRVVKAFNAEPHFAARFAESNEAYFREMRRLYKREYLSSPVSEVVSLTVMAVLLWFGGGLVLRGEGGLSGEWFIGYLVVFSQIIPPARAFSDGWFRIQKGSASLDRLDEILRESAAIADPNAPASFRSPEDSIVFNGVTYTYSTASTPVLQDFHLTIRKGETVALVGPSGSGKTTVAHLLARFADPVAGSISIDGVDLRSYTAADWRSHVGIVTQEAILFNDTVAANVSLGQPFDPDRLQAALTSANALDFVNALPGGLDAHVGEGGGKLSGGQRQRLSIARALYKDPPVLILDEATSALDTESEQAVQSAIDRLMKGRTSLVIAHRLSTVRHADRIVVLDSGRIVEQGTHRALMQIEKGVYQKLVNLQDLS